jgi:uncharacterized protein YgfB (UPF0149 family)
MTKTQHDYAPHNSDNLEEGWAAVQEYVKDAVLIAFDECHKIYLAMDEEEAYFFRTTYQPAVVESIHSTPEAMFATLEEWYEDSCGLKFISAVWHDDLDANDGFVDLISQFAGADEDEDEDEDEE